MTVVDTDYVDESDVVCVLSADAGYEQARSDRRAIALARKDHAQNSVVVEFEGLHFEIDTRPIWPIPGQPYFASRNSGWKLLVCAWVKWRESPDGNDARPDYVIPNEIAYCFNVYECYPIIRMLED